MSEYKGREHIEGILAEGGMREQALIAAGEEHMADSRSMILLCREVRFLRTANASLAAKVKELEAAKHESDGFLASMMDTVNQEIRENGPADVGQYYRRHDANNGVRYLADLLKRKAWDAQATLSTAAERERVLQERVKELEDRTDRLNKQRDSWQADAFHIGENLTATETALASALAREAGLRGGIEKAIAYGIPPNTESAIAMDRWDRARYAAMEEVKSFLRPLLSTPPALSPEQGKEK